MGTKILTYLRPANVSDILHCVCLGELEYEEIFQTTAGFNAEYCEEFIFNSLGRSDRFNYVLCDHQDIPFGYICAGLENLYMTYQPEAVVYHWFVNNPDHQYGQQNYGRMLLNAFEQWARSRSATSMVVSYLQRPGQERYLNRVFGRMGYQLNTVSYRKEL